MTDRELLQQVLYALEDIAEAGSDAWGRDRPCVEDAYGLIDALRARLAQPELEPVTCQIYGHVIGHCSECNVGIEKEANDSINETNHILATLYLNLKEQEPVAWFINSNSENDQPPHYEQVADQFNGIGDSFPLYTAPMQPAVTQLVTMTDANLNQLRVEQGFHNWGFSESGFALVARAVEAAHGIGNKT